MKKVFIVFLLFFALFSVCALNIDVYTAVELAMKNNIQVQTSAIDAAASKRKYETSWNTLVPSVQGTATLAKTNELSQVSSIIAQIMHTPLPENTPSLVFGLTIQETFNPAMITGLLAAKENYKNGQLSYEQTKEQVKVNIQKLYYAIVLQQEALEIQKETLKAQENRMLQAEKDFENGYVPEIYLLQTQVTYENNIPSIRQAETALLQSKRQLALLLGLDTSEELILTDKINQESVELNENKLLSHVGDRFDVRNLRSQEKILKLQSRALCESSFLPSIVASVSWQPVYSNAKTFKDDIDDYTDSGSKSVTVAWNITNLLPWSSSFQSVKELDDARQKLALSADILEKNAELEIRSLYDTAVQSGDAVKSSERTVNLAQKNYDMTLTAFENGSKDELDLRDAENQLKQAKLGRLSSQYNYICALINLEYATQQEIR